MAVLKLLSALAGLCAVVAAVPTVTTTTEAYTIDPHSEYRFYVTISRTNCDITSLQFYSGEYQASTRSHIGSGLGSGTVVSYSTSGDSVIVKCAQKSTSFPDLTHYYVFKEGHASIYMATNLAQPTSNGELRFIFRLAGLPVSWPYTTVSDTTGSTTAVEGSDVYIVNGQTRSKFYSSERFIDDRSYCATNSGSSVHACWLRPNHQATEKSLGGPFFRDINLNSGSAYNAMTYYMNSGHVPTEEKRLGFYGPYVFTMTRSGKPSPSAYDLSWFDSLNLPGYVKASARGKVTGTASGTSSAFPTVVHWFNANYQFWTYASSSGAFTSPPMPAGTYTMNLYQDEFLAASKSVSVSAGGTTSSSIAATHAVFTQSRTKIFQLGDYDGQPTGFLNADKQLRMHPSDSRMSNWNPVTVSSTSPASFPMAIFKEVNNGQKITFNLGSAIPVAATLRIATTLSFSGGRPTVLVNGWQSSTPAAPSKIDSRGVTRGAYRGYGEIYTWTVPAGTLVAGANTVTVSVISGSGSDGFLSANVIFDAIELFY